MRLCVCGAACALCSWAWCAVHGYACLRLGRGRGPRSRARGKEKEVCAVGVPPSVRVAGAAVATNAGNGNHLCGQQSHQGKGALPCALLVPYAARRALPCGAPWTARCSAPGFPRGAGGRLARGGPAVWRCGHAASSSHCCAIEITISATSHARRKLIIDRSLAARARSQETIRVAGRHVAGRVSCTTHRLSSSACLDSTTWPAAQHTHRRNATARSPDRQAGARAGERWLREGGRTCEAVLLLHGSDYACGQRHD